MSRRTMPRGRHLVPAALLLLVAGCDNKDSGPTGPSSNVDLDAQSVTQQSVATLSFVDGLVEGVDQLAVGDFSGVSGDLGVPSGALRADTPVWDGSAWVLDVQGTQSDTTGTTNYDVYFRVQYLDGGGTPQQNPDQTTTTMSMSLDYVVDAHTVDQGSTFDILLDYALDMTVGNLQGGPYSVDGTGDMNVDMQFTGDGDSLRLILAMGWAANLVVPANDGCPTGTASVTVQDWTFDADYDGLGHYDWTLYQGGAQVGQGQESLSCVIPAS